eukprot:1159957-Pelagomonas_calceolata.AAC.1
MPPITAQIQYVSYINVGRRCLESACHAGPWEYVGGETRLVGNIDTSNNSYEALEARMEQETNMKIGGADVSEIWSAMNFRNGADIALCVRVGGTSAQGVKRMEGKPLSACCAAGWGLLSI